MNFRKTIKILPFLIPWFLSSLLIKSNPSYYLNLNLPIFAPIPIIFAIIWPILYLLISYSIYNTFKKSTTNYKIYLTINYLANQLYTFCFFILKDNFLSLTDTIIVLISSLYLYQETKLLNSKYTIYLIPYTLWNLFVFILMFCIFITN